VFEKFFYPRHSTYAEKTREANLKLADFADWLAHYAVLYGSVLPLYPEDHSGEDQPQSYFRYYEAINQGGQQLEKPDVVKAKLLGPLSGDTKAVANFAELWNLAMDVSQKVPKQPKMPSPGNESAQANANGASPTLEELLQEGATDSKKKEGESENVEGGNAPMISQKWRLIVLAFKVYSSLYADHCGLYDQYRSPNQSLGALQSDPTQAEWFEQWQKALPTLLDNYPTKDPNQYKAKPIADAILTDNNEVQAENARRFIRLLYTLRFYLDRCILQRKSPDQPLQLPINRIEELTQNEVREDMQEEDETTPDKKTRANLREVTLLQAAMTTFLESERWLFSAMHYLLWITDTQGWDQPLPQHNGNEPVTAVTVFNPFTNNITAFMHPFFLALEEIERERVRSYREDWRAKKTIPTELVFGDRPTAYFLNLIEYVLAQQYKKKNISMAFTNRNSVEHIIPQSQQGSDELYNLALTSRQRNSTFSNASLAGKLSIFQQYRQENSYTQEVVESLRLYKIYNRIAEKLENDFPKFLADGQASSTDFPKLLDEITKEQLKYLNEWLEDPSYSLSPKGQDAS
jgi:hypothetical protein